MCAAEWQEIWPLIQGNIDNKLQKQTQQKYDGLKKNRTFSKTGNNYL
jgi:hypothetical protein